MPKITVWKCAQTNKLFEEEKEYKSHLRKLAKARQHARKTQQDLDQARAWWDQAQNIEMSIDDLRQWIIDNQTQFWRDSARYNQYDWEGVGKKTRKGVVMPIPELVEFTEFRLAWSDSVSNSHQRPHNGVTNWGGRTLLDDGTSAPSGYPGWYGQLSWKCKWPEEFSGVYLPGDIFDGRDCRIHTGSGGGGGWRDGLMSHSYGIYIFAADWPGLARYREKQIFWDALKKEYV